MIRRLLLALALLSSFCAVKAQTGIPGQGMGVPSTAPIIPGQIPGTATNDNATAGNVGEYVSSTVLTGSAVSLTTNTPANITSISLTAGDWDVSGLAYYNIASTTVLNVLLTSISTTSATLNLTPGNSQNIPFTGTVYGAATYSIPQLAVRISVASTTTVYFVTQAAFTTSTLSAYGIIRARRVR